MSLIFGIEETNVNPEFEGKVRIIDPAVPLPKMLEKEKNTLPILEMVKSKSARFPFSKSLRLKIFGVTVIMGMPTGELVTIFVVSIFPLEGSYVKS
jgi:hypothetical protein